MFLLTGFQYCLFKVRCMSKKGFIGQLVENVQQEMAKNKEMKVSISH